MWNNSAFGDNVSSGGGFFTNNGPNQIDSPQSKGKGMRRAQNITPVCIRQVRDSPEDEFKLFGMSTQILTVVAILKEYEVQSTKATYEIEDHTGVIKAVWWLENEGTTKPNLPLVKEGCYVRVYGSLRSQEGEKLLMVLKMFPVDNINEITIHLLDVIHARCEAEALNKGPGALAKIKRNNPGAELVNSMSFMDTDMAQEGFSNGFSSNGFSNIQERVYRILKPVNTKSGLHRSTIMEQFPSNQRRDVDAALEFLINEGHAYSTIDNDHFKATDSM